VRTLQKHENPPSIIAVSGSSRCTWQCILTHSVGHDGLDRDRNTNISAPVSENMWYQHILIELLAVLPLLQPHIRISSGSSLHCARRIQKSGSWCSHHFTAQKEKEVVKSGWFNKPHKLFVGTRKEVVKS
jgi:hypothetical protein